MTPNPQNIGAAPEGFSLEVGKTYETADGYQAKCFIDESAGPLSVKVEWLSGPLVGKKLWAYRNGAHWQPHSPQFNLVREVPSPDAAGVPEPQAKGPSPSEVPQPGEGVDLEAMRDALLSAPIHLLGESLESFLERYKHWYREIRRAALGKVGA